MLALCLAVVEPFKLRRIGAWSAVGGMLGYFGYKEQQVLKAALLERQQTLEKSESGCLSSKTAGKCFSCANLLTA